MQFKNIWQMTHVHSHTPSANKVMQIYFQQWHQTVEIVERVSLILERCCCLLLDSMLWAVIRAFCFYNYRILIDYIISLSIVKQNYARIPHTTSQKCAWLEMHYGAILSLLIIWCTNCQLSRVGKRFGFLLATKIIESPLPISLCFVCLSLC